jgi:hypothetical protein
LKTVLKKTLSVAASGKTTLVLLGALLIAFVVGQAMPWVYTSPVAAALLAVFFLNLLAVIVSSVPSVLRRCRADEPSEVADKAKPYVEVPVAGSPENVFQDIKKSLGRYRFASEGEVFLADRFRSGPLGTLLLYAALLLLLAGGVAVFYTRTSGEVILTEGQTFSTMGGGFRRLSPPKIGDLPRMGFTIVKIRPSGGGWDSKGLVADLEVFTPGGAERRSLAGGKAERISDGSLRINEIGVSPRITLMGPGGMVYEDAYVSLRVLYGEEDFYFFPATTYSAKFKFYPDYYKSKFGDGTRSLEINNPVFRVQIYKSDRFIQDELMKPGDQMYIDGLSFGIGDIRLWGAFIITRQEGTPLVIAGLIIGIVGLVWSLIFHRRVIRGQLRDGKLLITGESDYFPGLNKRRIEKLAERLRH